MNRYEGHSLCFAIWFFNNTYSHSVYSSFSKNPPSACTHLTILSNQLSMTPDHVYWGMSKMTPLKNVRRSETAFHSAAFWWKGTKTSHRGLNQVNMVGGWPAEHHWRLESPELQLLSARWHCHDRAADHGHPFGNALYTMPGRLQWLTYQSAVTVFLSSSGMVATWPNFAKKHAIICLEALLFLLNFTGGFSSGKTHTADCCFVSGSYWYTQVSSPVTMFQTRGDLPLSNFLSMWVHQSTLPYCSSLGLWGTQQA